ncbi:MAG: hypothetical protein LBT42_00850 [Tannerella sp.]|nr:hypothetical protein [Tannerella sp.]
MPIKDSLPSLRGTKQSRNTGRWIASFLAMTTSAAVSFVIAQRVRHVDRSDKGA